MWSPITQLTKNKQDVFQQQKQEVLHISQHLNVILENIAPSLSRSVVDVCFDNKIVVVQVADPLALHELQVKRAHIYSALVKKKSDVVDISFTIRS